MIEISTFENKILKYFDHQPTNDQKEAINKLSRFVFFNKKKVGLVIKGYAGTGKTTLISSLVKACNVSDKKIVLLAPTGRAAKVMSSYSNVAASTIHRYIYQVKQVKDRISFSLTSNLLKNTLFVIDEASMISGEDGNNTHNDHASNLLEDLLKYVYSGLGCKIIFVGDHAQLPPVGWRDSPALDVTYLNKLSEVDFYQFELTQVVRQAEESGILYESTQLRNAIENEQFSILISQGHKDISMLSNIDLQDYLETAFSNKKNGSESILICRSNKRANLYNKEIRSKILWHEDQINSGDIIMSVKNNYFWLEELKKEGFIANGDMLEVKKVINIESKYGLKFADIEVSLIDENDASVFLCKVILDVLMVDGPSLSAKIMRELYYEIENEYSYIKNNKQRRAKVLKSAYLNALQIKFAYALTCHKAQGGQWSNVFVDHGYLPGQSVDKELLRWMYTSFTRAMDRLYLLNFHQNFILKK